MTMNAHVIETSAAFVRSVKISAVPICAAVQRASTIMAILAKVNYGKFCVFFTSTIVDLLEQLPCNVERMGLNLAL